MKWYDTVELPNGEINFSSAGLTCERFMEILRENGAIMNPHGEDFVVRLRETTRRKLGLVGTRMIMTPIGRAMVMDR